MIAVADVAQEVRLEASVGEERRVDLGIVEPAHGAAIQPQGARSDDQVGALQRAVAKRGGLGDGLLAFSLEPGDGRRVMGKGARQVLIELRVVGDDRGHRRIHGFRGVAAAQSRPQLLLAVLGADENDPDRLRIGRGRTPFHDLVDVAQLLVGDRLGQPAVVRARIAKNLVERRIVEHSLPLIFE